MERKIYTIYGDDAHTMTKKLMEAACIVNRISKKDASIVLKPNLVTDNPPESGATTHPGVLSGAIEYLQENGFQRISIIEGAWVGSNTVSGYQVCGYDKVCRTYDVPFFDLKRDQVREMPSPVGPINICSRALDADYFINLPVLKGHCQTIMTCALKNCKGCLPDQEKRHFHAMGLQKPIAALASIIKPELTIVDSICGDLNFEEGGTPVQTNRMFLGFDPVEIDAYGCHLMGIDRSEVPYISFAEQYGAGSATFSEDDLIFLNQPSEAPLILERDRKVSKLTANVRQRSACSACFGNLVHALYRLDLEGCRCRAAISIGQEFSGKKVEGIGIGHCCAGAEIHVPGCPPSAEAIMKILRKHG